MSETQTVTFTSMVPHKSSGDAVAEIIAANEGLRLQLQNNRNFDHSAFERSVRQAHDAKTRNFFLELSIRLAGFGGLVPDETFTQETKAGLIRFQNHYIKRYKGGKINGNNFDDKNLGDPHDPVTLAAIDMFSKEYDINGIDGLSTNKTLWDVLQCTCSKCRACRACTKNDSECEKCQTSVNGVKRSGWGSGRERNHNETHDGRYKYEYPGIHRSLLFAVKALAFYLDQNMDKYATKDEKAFNRKYYIIGFSDGYRCVDYNIEKGNSTSTNHRGKAIDIQFGYYDNTKKVSLGWQDTFDGWKTVEKEVLPQIKDIRDRFCVQYLNAQPNWVTKNNRFSIEPLAVELGVPKRVTVKINVPKMNGNEVVKKDDKVTIEMEDKELELPVLLTVGTEYDYYYNEYRDINAINETTEKEFPAKTAKALNDLIEKYKNVPDWGKEKINTLLAQNFTTRLKVMNIKYQKRDITITGNLLALFEDKQKAVVIKSQNPSKAYSWIHLDVREYDAVYLKDEFFCKNPNELNKEKLVVLHSK